MEKPALIAIPSNRLREVINDNGTVTTTYYLRSSVLGSVVEELSSNGTKQTGYVYAPGGSLIATQVMASGSVTFKQVSPQGLSQYEFISGVASSVFRKEFDPAGATVPLFNHSPGHGGSVGEMPSAGDGALDGRFGGMNNPGAGCTQDGVWVPCDMAYRALEAGAATLAFVGSSSVTPAAMQKAVWVEGNGSRGVVNPKTGVLDVFRLNDGHFEWIPIGEQIVASPALRGVLQKVPQDPTLDPKVGEPSLTLNRAIARVKKRLKGDCLKLFANFNPGDYLRNHLAIGNETPQGKTFQRQSQLATSSWDSDDNGNRLPSGGTVFNQTGNFFSAFPPSLKETSSQYGLTQKEIQELAILHELFHISDVGGLYDDDTRNNVLNEQRTKAINKILREKCGFPTNPSAN